MKNSVFLKFIAFLLCAASLAAAALGGIGAIGVEGYQLYTTTPQQIADEQLEGRAMNLAVFHIQEYVQEAYTNLSKNEYSRLFSTENWNYYYSSLESLEIRDKTGSLVHGINTPEPGAKGHTFTLSAEYPMVLEKTVTPYSGSENAVEGIVIAGYLNIRPSPSPSGEVLDQLRSGDHVMILETRSVNGAVWGRIDKGWINLAYVSLLEDGESIEPTEMPTDGIITGGEPALVTHDLLTVYAAASLDSEIVSMLDFNAQVWIFESRVVNGAPWGRIDQGWIQLDYVKYVEGDVEPTDPSARTGLIITDGVIIFSEPSATSADNMILDAGAYVNIYEETISNGITWGRTDYGWVDMDYVSIVDSGIEAESTTEPLVPFTEEELLDEPSATSIDPDLGEPLYYSEQSYSDGLNEVVYKLGYYQSPELEVTVYLDESYVLSDIQLITELYTWREHFIPALLGGLLVFAMTFVYLCATAGRTPAGELRPSGLNRVPLDVYFVGACALCVACGAGMVFVIDRGSFETAFFRTVLGLGALAIAIALVGFCFCFAAQVKVKGHYWWHHSLTGWCVDFLLRLLSKCLLPLRAMARGSRALFRMLPVVWQWLGVTLGLTALAVLFLILCATSYGMLSVLSFFLFAAAVLGFIAAICYGAYAYGILMKGVQHMAQGDLNHKVPTRHLYGTFRDFGEKLNSLGSAANLAAQRQMKSERMKTELITNVSHDIKTPLTSIINFVDLLKKPHTPAEGAEYLDVLDRQSQRLKKLIDDLMEMSKASTGNLTVELEQVDAVEAVNQALGEFADKLAAVGLTPLFRHPETPVILRADGRLVWRVLSNVLHNAVKYALPNTRLYIDLNVIQGNAVLAIKNISREQLNVDAEELMERFVRGDSSRNTEGSGLGLNIAKSLVELQQGQMHLMVDGDLFKVTLIFPLD